MESPLRTMLLDQDRLLEAEELDRVRDLEAVRAKRKAVALLLASESNGGLVGSVVRPETGTVTAVRDAGTPTPRPRRGWSKIIRDILTVHPGSTFKEIHKYALDAGLKPADAPDFELRLRFALRDMTQKDFTLIHKVDKKTPATYTLNPNKQ